MEDVARFECQFDSNITAIVQWVINSKTVSSLDLPNGYEHERGGRVLIVRNIQQRNNSVYQCILRKVLEGEICEYPSNIGELRIKCGKLVT